MAHTINTGFSSSGFRSLDKTLSPEIEMLGSATIYIENFGELPPFTKIGMVCGLENHCATDDVSPVIDNTISDDDIWFFDVPLKEVVEKTSLRYLVYFPGQNGDDNVIIAVDDIHDFIRGIANIPSHFPHMPESADWKCWEDVLFIDCNTCPFHLTIADQVQFVDIPESEFFQRFGARLETEHSIYGITPLISFEFESFPDVCTVNVSEVIHKADVRAVKSFVDSMTALRQRYTKGLEPGLVKTLFPWTSDFDGDACNFVVPKDGEFVPWEDKKEFADILARQDAERALRGTRALTDAERKILEASRDRQKIAFAKEQIKDVAYRYVMKEYDADFIEFLLDEAPVYLKYWMVCCFVDDGKNPYDQLIKEIGCWALELEISEGEPEPKDFQNRKKYFYECTAAVLEISCFERHFKNVKTIEEIFKSVGDSMEDNKSAFELFCTFVQRCEATIRYTRF